MATTDKRIIALYSDRPQCGKTTAATMLWNALHPSVRLLSFAQPIREMVWKLLEVAGIKEYENKESLLPILGVSVRYLMQTLGTEWGRQGIDENVWVRLMMTQIERTFTQTSYAYVIIDDMRFPNEYEMLKELGCRFWKIERPRGGVSGYTHASEGALNDFRFDEVIVNDGTLLDFKNKVISYVVKTFLLTPANSISPTRYH